MADQLENHAIVAGFGLPGRVAADWLADHGISYCVVELNPETEIISPASG